MNPNQTQEQAIPQANRPRPSYISFFIRDEVLGRAPEGGNAAVTAEVHRLESEDLSGPCDGGCAPSRCWVVYQSNGTTMAHRAGRAGDVDTWPPLWSTRGVIIEMFMCSPERGHTRTCGGQTVGGMQDGMKR